MTATPIRRSPPLTEVQILRARYDEARQIKDAWQHRLNQAHRAHSHALRNGHDIEATQRNIHAVEIEFLDAVGELEVARELWAHATTYERRAS